MLSALYPVTRGDMTARRVTYDYTRPHHGATVRSVAPCRRRSSLPRFLFSRYPTSVRYLYPLFLPPRFGAVSAMNGKYGKAVKRREKPGADDMKNE